MTSNLTERGDLNVQREQTSATAVRPRGLRTLDSRELFAGGSEIGIEHDGAFYRLRITRQGKLILNK